jgi:hypothetical protein
MTIKIDRQRFSAALAHCVSAILVVVAAGCMALPRKSTSSSTKTASIRRDASNRPAKISPTVLSVEVARFADELTALVAQAADSFAAEVGTPEARATALAWKTGAANSSLIIATGANPTANLLDMVVLVTLERMAFQDYWLPHFGKPAEPLLAITRDLEQEIWMVAERVLTPQQQKDLRELIDEWREKHPQQIYISVRFRDFAEIAAQEDVGPNAKPGSLFSLAFLDPFAGLDPTTRELAQTRFFAERALYVLERMPKLLRWQSELVIAQTIANPDVQQLVSNSTEFAQSAGQLTLAVQKFPEQLAVEREKMVKDLDAEIPQWHALVTQLQHTFQAGNEMASSVDAAVKSLDAFVGRVAPARSNAGPAVATSGSTIAIGGSTNTITAKPFDVTEYGAAAAQIAYAAQQLDTLTHSLEASTPQINAVVERTGLQGKELVDYTFYKALWFLVVALVGLVLAMLAYRWIASRLSRRTVADRAGK